MRRSHTSTIVGSTKGMPSFGDSAVYRHNKAALKKYAAAAVDHAIEPPGALLMPAPS